MQYLAKKTRIFASHIGDYNPGLSKNKIPLDVLQTDAAFLAREFAGLYGKIGEKIRNNDDLER